MAGGPFIPKPFLQPMFLGKEARLPAWLPLPTVGEDLRALRADGLGALFISTSRSDWASLL